MEKAAAFLYSLTLALWAGGMAIFTFVITPVIFRAFSRDVASTIVDKLFPLYFPYNLVLSALALAFFLLAGLNKNAGSKLPVALIIIAIVINLFICFKLFPAAKEIKQKIVSFENTPPDSPARKQFQIVHGLSAVLNLLLLADGTALIFLRSFRIY